MEISHHKGIEKFNKVGCYLFNLINNEYAKNYSNVTQSNSSISPPQSENETFHILFRV